MTKIIILHRSYDHSVSKKIPDLILKKSCTWLITCPAEQAVRATPIPVTWMTREEDSLLTGQVSFRISMQMGSLRQHIRRTGDNIGLWAQ